MTGYNQGLSLRERGKREDPGNDVESDPLSIGLITVFEAILTNGQTVLNNCLYGNPMSNFHKTSLVKNS